MTTHPLLATWILCKWREVVNVILWQKCTSRGGVEPDMLNYPMNETEQKWQLSWFLTWAKAALSSLCVLILLRRRKFIVHGSVLVNGERQNAVTQAQRRKKAHMAHHCVFYPASLREEVVGGCSQYKHENNKFTEKSKRCHFSLDFKRQYMYSKFCTCSFFPPQWQLS